VRGYGDQACGSVSGGGISAPAVKIKRLRQPTGAFFQSGCARELLQLAGDARERSIELGAEAVDDGDDGDRDAGRNEAVFDRCGARLILQ
jgi:hypothetical protein